MLARCEYNHLAGCGVTGCRTLLLHDAPGDLEPAHSLWLQQRSSANPGFRNDAYCTEWISGRVVLILGFGNCLSNLPALGQPPAAAWPAGCCYLVRNSITAFSHQHLFPLFYQKDFNCLIIYHCRERISIS